MDEDRKEMLAQRKKEDMAKQKEALAKKYKDRGIQKMSLAEYEAARKKLAMQRKRLKLPPQVTFVLKTPFLILFVLGLRFLPYIVYLIATSPSADDKKTKTTINPPVDTQTEKR